MFGFFAKERKSRLIQLDFLRGVAIILIMFRHMPILTKKAGFLARPAEYLQHFGWTGVDLFFVLSGFLVGGLLFNELRNRSSLKTGRFMIRRLFKIWPVYFTYLGFLMVIFYFGDQTDSLKSTIKLLLPNLLHVQNYFTTPRDHTWSLAVEEHFYLALPLVLFLAVRSNRPVKSIPAIPIISVIIILGCTALRYRINYIAPIEKNMIFPTHLRMDGLFFGVLLAYLYHFHHGFLRKIAKRRITLLAVGFLLLSPMIYINLNTPFVLTFGFTLIYLGYGLILIAVFFMSSSEGLSGKFFSGRFAKVVAFIGFYSYSIYLWHFEVFIRMLNLLNNIEVNAFTGAALWLGAYVVYFIVSFAVGILIGALVERPFLKLRDRLYPSRAKALT